MLGKNLHQKIQFWNKNKFFPCPFLATTSWFLNLAEAFQNDYVAAGSTPLRSATEKNELSTAT